MSYCHTHPYYPTSMGMGRRVEKYLIVSANMTNMALIVLCLILLGDKAFFALS